MEFIQPWRAQAELSNERIFNLGSNADFLGPNDKVGVVRALNWKPLETRD